MKDDKALEYNGNDWVESENVAMPDEVLPYEFIRIPDIVLTQQDFDLIKESSNKIVILSENPDIASSEILSAIFTDNGVAKVDAIESDYIRLGSVGNTSGLDLLIDIYLTDTTINSIPVSAGSIVFYSPDPTEQIAIAINEYVIKDIYLFLK